MTDPDRTCVRCGAVLGVGNDDHCGAACVELERRGIANGREIRQRHEPMLIETKGLRVFLTRETIK